MFKDGGTLQALCEAFEEADEEFLIKTIDEFNVYDRRMIANVLTTIAPYFDNDERLRLLNQLRVSTFSVSTYASERSSRSSRIRSRSESDERTIRDLRDLRITTCDDSASHQDQSQHNLTNEPGDDLNHEPSQKGMDVAIAPALEVRNQWAFKEHLKTADV